MVHGKSRVESSQRGWNLRTSNGRKNPTGHATRENSTNRRLQIRQREYLAIKSRGGSHPEAGADVGGDSTGIARQRNEKSSMTEMAGASVLVGSPQVLASSRGSFVLQEQTWCSLSPPSSQGPLDSVSQHERSVSSPHASVAQQHRGLAITKASSTERAKENGFTV